MNDLALTSYQLEVINGKLVQLLKSVNNGDVFISPVNNFYTKEELDRLLESYDLQLTHTINNLLVPDNLATLFEDLELASELEVINGTNDTKAVSPNTLSKKIADYTKVGVAKLIDYLEENQLNALTPKVLNTIKANETSNGLAQIATYNELKAGVIRNKAVLLTDAVNYIVEVINTYHPNLMKSANGLDSGVVMTPLMMDTIIQNAVNSIPLPVPTWPIDLVPSVILQLTLTGSNNIINISNLSGFGADLIIDWGDETYSFTKDIVNNKISHTYNTSIIKDAKLRLGNTTGIKKISFKDNQCIVDINKLSITTLEDTTDLFRNCKNIKFVPQNFLQNMLGLKIVNGMFRDSGIEYIMDGLLNNCKLLTNVSYLFNNTTLKTKSNIPSFWNKDLYPQKITHTQWLPINASTMINNYYNIPTEDWRV